LLYDSVYSGRFLDYYDPTLEDFYKKQHTVRGEERMLNITDTAGQDDFRAVRESHYSRGEGFLCVYDITQRRTFEEVEEFYQDILLAKDMPPSVPFVLVANKCDDSSLKRNVTREEGEALAKKLKCKYLEASAKTNTNVSQAFELIAEEILDHGAKSMNGAGGDQMGGTSNKNGKKDKKKKKKCALF